MSHPPRFRPLRAGLVAGIAVLILNLAAPTANATGFNRYTVTLSPGSVATGASASFTATVKNQSPIGVLNELKLTVPSSLVIGSLSSSRGIASRSGNIVSVKWILLFPGKSFTVTVGARASCGASGSAAWGTSAKGLLGFPFFLNSSGSSLTTTFIGACHLAFLEGGQPQDAAPGEAISSVDSDPSGGPVRVGAYGGGGALIMNPPVIVSVAIGNNPSSGSLSGTTSDGTNAGVAEFPDVLAAATALSIDNPGEAYTLVATATDFVSATSDPFTIAGVIVHCEADVDCEASLDDGGPTQAVVSALADPSAPTLTASFTDEALDCDGYEEKSPGTLLFNVTSSREKRVTFTFETGIDDYYGPNPNDFQVCYESPTPFAERFEGAMVTLGLLPDCDVEDDYYDTNPPPCISDRFVDGTTVVLTFTTPAGDPKGRV